MSSRPLPPRKGEKRRLFCEIVDSETEDDFEPPAKKDPKMLEAMARVRQFKKARRKPNAPESVPAAAPSAPALAALAAPATAPIGEGRKFRRLVLSSSLASSSTDTPLTVPAVPAAGVGGEAGAYYNRLVRAAAALRPAAPKQGLLPCRSTERQRIDKHLRSGIQQGGSRQVLYVSGMPGTGKTAIVLEVLDQLKSESPFHLVHVNAMRLGAPVQVFKEIADQMLSSATISEARSEIADYFTKQTVTDPVIVLLIDEVDCLVTPNQSVLYKVFDWLGLPNARLVLAAISNTMDLPERLLPRVASRFHIERVDFAPYDKNQLYDILCSRLRGHDALGAFADVVLRLCSARVASASGDIRKALQVCRRVVETRMQTSKREGALGLEDLQAAEKEIVFANPIAQAIEGLTTQSQRFLTAAVIQLRHNQADGVLLKEVASRFLKLLDIVACDESRGCAASSDSGFTSDFRRSSERHAAVSLMVQRLQAMSILAKSSRDTMSSEICDDDEILSLGSMDVEDLASALQRAECDSTIRQLLESGRQGMGAVYVPTARGKPPSSAEATCCSTPTRVKARLRSSMTSVTPPGKTKPVKTEGHAAHEKQVDTAKLPKDAPPGHPAHKNVRYSNYSPPLVFFHFEGTRFQTTICAAGSRRAAEVIARACYVRFEQGEDKEAVLKFRSDCYARLNSVGPAPEKAFARVPLVCSVQPVPKVKNILLD